MSHFFKLIIFLLLLGMSYYAYILNFSSVTWTSINVSHSIQGDAHLISKGNTHFLIDTGSHREAEPYLIPYLQKQHIKHLDAVLITHAHFDHYGGLITILENNISIGRIYMNMPTPYQMQCEPWGGQMKHLTYIQEYSKKHHIPLLPIVKDMTLSFDKKSYLKVLYIYDGIHSPVGNTDINDMSAITMLFDDKNRFLLTGDLNTKLGTYLAKNAEDIQADILKVPHHGARSLAPNSFIAKVSPKTLIVPTTTNLWCSDRCKRIRELAQKKGYEVYVNGFHGDITVTSHDNKTIISTEKSPKVLCKEAQ